jgi:MoxR-like ATPase
VATAEQIFAARALLDEVYVDEKVLTYIVDLVFATREPKEAGLPELEPLILYGVSPRGTVSLTLAARAFAFLDGRGFVTPHDVKSIALSVMRHRVITTFEAEAEEITSERVIQRVLDTVPVP